MDKAVPWASLLAAIEPHYPKSGRRGRWPMPLATMLRIYYHRSCTTHSKFKRGKKGNPPSSWD
jgi:hypothetical protein